MIKKQNRAKRSRQFAVGLLILLFFVPANAEWTTYKRIERRSKEGHLLRFDTDTKSNIRAWFILKKKTVSVFDSNLPLYQVDNNEVHDLQEKKEKKIKKDHWIRWKISKINEAPDSDLVEFMNGKEVTFQYYLPDGSIKETTFRLEGAREAIEEILK